MFNPLIKPCSKLYQYTYTKKLSVHSKVAIVDHFMQSGNKDLLEVILNALNASGDDGSDFEDMYGNYPMLPKGNQNNIPESLQKEWKDKGWCPKCGKPGHFSHFQYTCKEHGPY